MNRRIVAGLVAIVFASGFVSADEVANPPVPPAEMDAARASMLQRVVAQQRDQIAALKAQVTLLTAQLESLGIKTNGVPSTQPAVKQAGKAKRIIFVRATSDADAEIIQAVGDLEPDQWFNVVTAVGDKAVLFQPQLVAASEFNKKKLERYIPTEHCGTTAFVPAIAVAARVHPDVIWMVANGTWQDEDDIVGQVRRILRGSTTRVNTTTTYARFGPPAWHLLWRIAHETGGVCVDRTGNAIDEPMLPVVPVLPRTPEPRKPSILRENPTN